MSRQRNRKLCQALFQTRRWRNSRWGISTTQDKTHRIEFQDQIIGTWRHESEVYEAGTAFLCIPSIKRTVRGVQTEPRPAQNHSFDRKTTQIHSKITWNKTRPTQEITNEVGNWNVYISKILKFPLKFSLPVASSSQLLFAYSQSFNSNCMVTVLIVWFIVTVWAC